MSPPTTPPARSPLADDFGIDLPRGRAVGTRTADGHARQGIDVEGVISADHDQLRLAPLRTPGFGRAGISYGPFDHEPGLTLCVRALNGHNTSQSYRLKDFSHQVVRWIRGGRATSPLAQLRAYLGHKAREPWWRRIACWREAAHVPPDAPPIQDNLAIGFFPRADSPLPLGEGSALVMHAASHECGELRSTISGRALTAFVGFQNVPACYIALRRADGSVLYAVGGLAGARGVAAWPRLRPVAIDPTPRTGALYAGIHQAVLGEIGFSVDTRVERVDVRVVEDWKQWFGPAIVADELRELPIDGSRALHGGAWRVRPSPQDGGTRCTLACARPATLLHARIAAARGALLLRDDGEGHALRVGWDAGGVTLGHGAGGALARSEGPIGVGEGAAIQVCDDEFGVRVAIDGVPACMVERARLAGLEGTGVGFEGLGSTPSVRWFEAHAEFDADPGLGGGAFWDERGEEARLDEDFAGLKGDLQGRRVWEGGWWRRVVGRGRFVGGGVGARVEASVERPCEGRTLYVVGWEEPAFAEVRVRMTPPGTSRGQGHEGRGGVVLWQDDGHHVIVNVWLHDGYEGASISSFWVQDGFDDIYNAVWTNVGGRVAWGREFELGVAFDGENLVARVDGEPVLYRRLSDVYPGARRWDIWGIGLAANWEFGCDTGTRFSRFTALARGMPVPGGGASAGR